MKLVLAAIIPTFCKCTVKIINWWNTQDTRQFLYISDNQTKRSLISLNGEYVDGKLAHLTHLHHFSFQKKTNYFSNHSESLVIQRFQKLFSWWLQFVPSRTINNYIWTNRTSVVSYQATVGDCTSYHEVTAFTDIALLWLTLIHQGKLRRVLNNPSAEFHLLDGGAFTLRTIKIKY